MAVIENHPIRMRRLRAGLTQGQLAQKAKITRATVASIEEGRTITINPGVLKTLAKATNTTPEKLAEEYAQWRGRDTRSELTERARKCLSLPPSIVEQYPSFQVWMGDVASNPTKFASILRIPRSTVGKYTDARGSMALPKSIVNALAVRLGLDDDYIEAVRNLDVE